MSAIAICNPKGGTGKTTVSLNLATLLQNCGASVTLLDLDPQSSLYDCVLQRPASLPKIECFKTSALKSIQYLNQKRHSSHIYIIDCPSGFDAKSLSNLLPYLNGMIIPVSASMLDYNAFMHYLFNLAKLDTSHIEQLNTVLVINKFRKQVNVQNEVINWYKKLSISTISELRDTVNYSMTTHCGIGISEMKTSRVLNDVKAWLPVLTWINDRLKSNWNFSIK